MATYTVEPLPDGVSQRGSWQVTKNNRTRVSSHVKKAAANAVHAAKPTRGIRCA